MNQRQMQEMVRDRKPVTLAPDRSVKEACALMRERRVGAVLVTEPNGRLAGIFTGRDAVCRVLAEGLDPAETALADAMTANPDTMAPNATAIDALRLMQDGGYRHVPVTDGDRVVGIVSARDFRGLEQARLDEESGLWERIW